MDGLGSAGSHAVWVVIEEEAEGGEVLAKRRESAPRS
jgi:hypothetical protein